MIRELVMGLAYGFVRPGHIGTMESGVSYAVLQLFSQCVVDLLDIVGNGREAEVKT